MTRIVTSTVLRFHQIDDCVTGQAEREITSASRIAEPDRSDVRRCDAICKHVACQLPVADLAPTHIIEATLVSLRYGGLFDYFQLTIPHADQSHVPVLVCAGGAQQTCSEGCGTGSSARAARTES